MEIFLISFMACFSAAVASMSHLLSLINVHFIIDCIFTKNRVEDG